MAGEEALVGVPGARGGVLYLMGALTLTTLWETWLGSRKEIINCDKIKKQEQFFSFSDKK